MKTTIYLDVDGVLNVLSIRNPSPKFSGWDLWQSKEIRGWPIKWSPAMIAAINELAAHPNVTFKWLTTWQDAAADELSPAIGINGQEWETLRGDQHGPRGLDWWKLQAIRDDAAASEGQRFVWIDDDISTETESINWAQSRADVLAVSPSPVQGLTRGHLEQIKHFIEQE